MKKNLVLFSLFIVPILVYLFFASGVNHFTKLPVISEGIPDVTFFEPVGEDTITLNGKITVLAFPGSELLKNKGNFFNFNQKIYNKYKDLHDFQVVLITPIGAEDQVQQMRSELYQISDFSKYLFIYTEPQKIRNYYNTLGLRGGLDVFCGTSLVYIVDKERNLRGRKGVDKKGVEEYKEGYNTISAADLHNEMGDDFKILVYEYRNASKKNKSNRDMILKKEKTR